MTTSEIANLRLHYQHLIGDKFDKPEEVVNWLGAVQAQDYPAARWGLGLRLKNATDSQIEQAYNDGRILRTHMMRPTWHFVTPENIRWILKLTSPRVHAMNAHMKRKLELGDKELSRSQHIVIKFLQHNNFLTRQELSQKLADAGIQAKGQRLAYIVMHLELEAFICSGPRRGKQFTYALLDERASASKKLDREEALAKLTLKYFQSHGPAQVRDFAWWSGLGNKDARLGIELVKSKMVKKVEDKKEYWFSPNTYSMTPSSTTAFLLSIYDEYTIAYNDRSALGGEKTAEKLLMMGNALTAVVVVNGQIVGTWKRKLKKSSVDMQLSLLRKLTKEEADKVSKAVKNYKAFLGF